MIRLQLEYGIDPMGMGFFWPGAPAKRAEYLQVKKSHPGIAEAIYQCQPGALEGEIFKDQDFRYYNPPRRLMDGISANMEFVATSDMIVQSWDTAFSAKTDADWSVCVTGMLVPCKSSHGLNDETMRMLGITEEDPHYDVYILEVFRAKLDFGDLVQSAVTQYKKWRPSYVLVEKRASGVPLMTTLEERSIPVLPQEPGVQSKRSRAVHGVSAGSAQGWVQQHRVWFPKVALWLEEFTRELKNFSGDDEEINDQVDAFVQLVNFAITQGSQAAITPSDQDPNNYGEAPLEGKQPLQLLAGLQGASEQPQICQFCIHYNKEASLCRYHQRLTTALDSCEFFDDGSDDNPF